MSRLVNKYCLYTSFFMMLISLSLSCEINSNSSLINYFTNEINEYGVEYHEILNTVDTINTQNVQYRVQYWPNFKKHLVVDEYHYQDSTFVDDFVFPELFHDFFYKRKFRDLLVEVSKEVRFAYIHKRNFDFNNVDLVYFYKGFDEGIKEYKEKGFDIYSGSEIPKNYSNWLYKINDQWAVLSPKKED
jgi:hypothetical protein